MLSSSIFIKSLAISSNSISSILKKLEVLFGCIYLQNNGSPIIAVLPESYCIAEQKKLQSYSRNAEFNYTNSQEIKSLTDFVEFSNLNSTQKLSNNLNSHFNGGYIGFFDYNFSAYQQNISTKFKKQPTFYLGKYTSYLSFEHGEWFFYSTESHAAELYLLIQNTISRKQHHQVPFQLKTPCQARWEKRQYQHAFNQVQNYITAGDCYQINLTQAFTAHAQGPLLDIAHDVWQLTDAPYSGYLKINDFELLSCSPELFIEFKENRELVTKPIKGTMPRFADPVLDQRSKQILTESKKDQAENVMIVDLLRNDLSKYAKIGSVKTPKLFEIESFNQVHHMVSEVTATLKDDVNPLDVLLSALPGGSITGAPKIRAMQIIEELEAMPRGAYCGSMGYFNFDGTGSWNILIRSIQKYQDELSLWAGGGITIASNCDAEYQECFDKVSAILDLLNTWQKPD